MLDVNTAESDRRDAGQQAPVESTKAEDARPCGWAGYRSGCRAATAQPDRPVLTHSDARIRTESAFGPPRFELQD